MSAAECSTVEAPIEYPDRDWRRALAKSTEEMRKRLRAERDKRKAAGYDTDGRIWWVADMSDAVLERVARTYAIRRVEHAIRVHESRDVQQRVRSRSGRAQ